ncbi:MAG: asparagine synthetase B family protein [bacterium]
MKIDLTINNGFNWYHSKDIWAKGFLFDSKNDLYEKEKLVDYFIDIKNKEDFEERLKGANGFFSVVIKDQGRIYAAVDSIRSHPLFFSEKYQWIGDNPDFLKKSYTLKKDQVSKHEFFATGYVTGNETIYENIFQCQAGQYVYIKDKLCQLSTYYQYLHQDFVNYSELEARAKLDSCVTNAIKRLVAYAKGRQLVIPLSGGYDSRLIALKLKKLNYTNVCCFSYGPLNNSETVISKKVADYLRFKWVFVDYKPIVKRLYSTKDMMFYYQFSHRAVSLPHIQDYFAVHQLKEKRLIEKDSIFVPGHTGDFLAGGHLSQIEYSLKQLDKDKIIARIIKKHYLLFKLSRNKKSMYLQKIQNNLAETSDRGDNSSLLSCWNWQERQAKFIVNSCRVYEFFGYEWICPLWDKELMEYFKRLPMKFRKNKLHYDTYVNQLDTNLALKVSMNQTLLKKCLRNSLCFIRKKLKSIDILVVVKGYLNFKKHILCFDSLISLKEYINLSFRGHRGINGVELFLFGRRSQQ